MPWIRARFKERAVWALLGPGGQLHEEGGRVAIRYSDKEGATIYRAGASRVVADEAGETRDLPPGESADAKKNAPKQRATASRASGFGSAGTRTAAQARAASADARQTLASLPEGTHVAFTDGSCQGNPGPAGAGAVVRLADGRSLEASRALGIATNNVGELTAIGMALDLLLEGGVDPTEPVALFTDSKYAMGVLVEGWKAKANKELIQAIRTQLVPWSALQVLWVAGHVGIEMNERADALAGQGARESASGT